MRVVRRRVADVRLIASGDPLFGSAAHRLGLSGGSATSAREALEQQV